MSAILIGYIFDIINGSFGGVTTGINHIKVFVADQMLIGSCFKGFECKMNSGCVDKNIA
jgi:hypothetical protein